PLRPRPSSDSAPMARRGGAQRIARAQRHDACNSDFGWAPFRAHGAVQGCGRWTHPLREQLREPKGPGNRAEPGRRAGLFLARARATNPNRGTRRAGIRGGVRSVFPLASARQPARRVGFTAEQPDRVARGARGALRSRAPTLRGARRGAPAFLGHLRRGAGERRALDLATVAAPRSLPLSSHRRRLVDHPTRTVTSASTPSAYGGGSLRRGRSARSIAEPTSGGASQ